MANTRTGKLISNPVALINRVSRPKLIPFAAIGIIAFYLTSTSDLNYFWRGYLTLIIAQSGILLLYFLRRRLAKTNKSPFK